MLSLLPFAVSTSACCYYNYLLSYITAVVILSTIRNNDKTPLISTNFLYVYHVRARPEPKVLIAEHSILRHPVPGGIWNEPKN